MPTKDWSKYEFKSDPTKAKQAELKEEYKELKLLKKDVDEKSKQKIDQVITISKSIYWLNKNKEMCPDLFKKLVAKTLSNSNDADTMTLGSLLAAQIQSYETAVTKFIVPSNRGSSLVVGINNNHKKFISAFEAYKTLVIAEVAAQNPNSERAKALLASSTATSKKQLRRIQTMGKRDVVMKLRKML